jgi:integrase
MSPEAVDESSCTIRQESDSFDVVKVDGVNRGFLGGRRIGAGHTESPWPIAVLAKSLDVVAESLGVSGAAGRQSIHGLAKRPPDAGLSVVGDDLDVVPVDEHERGIRKDQVVPPRPEVVSDDDGARWRAGVAQVAGVGMGRRYGFESAHRAGIHRPQERPYLPAQHVCHSHARVVRQGLPRHRDTGGPGPVRLPARGPGRVAVPRLVDRFWQNLRRCAGYRGTFERKVDADRWLASVEQDLMQGDWTDPEVGRIPLGEYAARWVRSVPTCGRSRGSSTRALVRLHIAPGLGGYDLVSITPARVRTWRAGLHESGLGASTVAKAYRLLRTIMGTAVEDRLIRANPCQLNGASVERPTERPTLTVSQVFAVADALPEHLRCLPLLATFCSLRWGEVTALARQDVLIETDLAGRPTGGWVHVRNAVVELADGSFVVGPPKTVAGRRVVAVPAVILPDVVDHLQRFTGKGAKSYVLVGKRGGLLRRSNFQTIWRQALATAGVEGLHFHDLRHTGNTLSAQAGATLPALMARMGHASSRTALIYLHTSSTRDRAVAHALDGLVRRDRARSGHDAEAGDAAGETQGPATGTDLRWCWERVTGIEPALSAWEAEVLPLNYTRAALGA